jgi:hypothetical protein
MLIILHPYYPENPNPGQPLDSFIAELPDGTRSKPMRSPMHGAARWLRTRGVADDEMLEFQHTGATHIAAYDYLGNLAEWVVRDSPKRGLAKVRYVPFSGLD